MGYKIYPPPSHYLLLFSLSRLCFSHTGLFADPKHITLLPYGLCIYSFSHPGKLHSFAPLPSGFSLNITFFSNASVKLPCTW